MVTKYGLDQTCGSDCNLPCSSSTSDKEIKQKLNVDGIVLSKNNFYYLNKNIGEINEFDDEIIFQKLKLIYTIFIKFIESTNFRITLGKKFVDEGFVEKIFSLFYSEDCREREQLAKILKRIYSKFISLRIFIKKQINYLIFNFIYEDNLIINQKFIFIKELLEVFNSIVDVFKVPLKMEQKELFIKILLPLHKPINYFNFYSEKLTELVVRYIEMDQSLIHKLILIILKYWPNENSNKQIKFLDEIKIILSKTELEQFQKIIPKLFSQISKCIESNHYKISTNALQLWKEEGKIKYLFKECNNKITPIIFSSLYFCSKNHWNNSVKNLSEDVKNILAERDWKLWNKMIEINSE
uniref:Uncharacterized protein n=1 Tax=Meloidogyne enterolobii TaxID=390850 RepID=A0A6V7VRM1_MELEN|nr:unnamed protein product [Meloidogyne enterolobii]